MILLKKHRIILFYITNFILFFCFFAIVKADTLYWYSLEDSKWTNMENWWADSSHTTPAAGLPQAADDTVIFSPTIPVIDLDDGDWVEPTSIDASSTGIIVTSAVGNSLGLSNLYNINGNIVFRGNVNNFLIHNGHASFYDDSINEGFILGTASFYNNAVNSNAIEGSAIFNDSSHNRGTVDGGAILYDSSFNISVIDGDAVFNDSSFNGHVEGVGQVTGNATFTYLTATDGVVTDPYGYANGYVSGETYDSLGAPILTWNFLTTDNTAAVSGGNAIFNPGTYSRASVDGNIFYNNSPNPWMLRFGDYQRIIDLGDQVDFSFRMFDKLGNSACPQCTYDVSVSPLTSVNISDVSGNEVTGNFTPTRLGTYSLIVDIVNPVDGSRAKWNDIFFVVQPSTDVATQTARYYIRDDLPVNNSYKGNGHDTGSLLLSLPLAEEDNWCTAEIMNTVDELPSNFPVVSLLSELDAHIIYKTEIDSKIGIQRLGTADQTNFDMEEVVASSTDYGPTDLSFQDINWTMNSPVYFYRLGIKLAGPARNPFWRSTPSDPSYIDLNYKYSLSPLVRIATQTNMNVLVLSASQSVTGGADDTSIVLNYPFSSSTSTELLIGEQNLSPFRNPFLGYTTTINSDKTAILRATGVSGTTTINSVALEVSPDSGSIDVSGVILSSTGEGGTYYPSYWLEAGSGDKNISHVVGNLRQSASYNLKIDNGLTLDDIYQSDSSGRLSFSYSGDYTSPHTFSLSLVDNGAGVADTYNNAKESAGGFLEILRDKEVPQVVTPIASSTITQEINKMVKSGYSPFTRDLKLNSVSPDVKMLQIFLNTHGYPISRSGSGSVGLETNYFGLKTKSALIKFQKANNIVPASGYFGVKTRNFIKKYFP